MPERKHLLKRLRELSVISSETSLEKYEAVFSYFFIFYLVEMELKDLVGLATELKGPGAWSTPNVIRIGGLLAAKVNAIQNLSGGEKLKLVQRVLLQVLAEAENKEIAEPGMTKEEIQKIRDRYDLLEATVGDVLPVSLELAIKAARGGLNLKKISPTIWVKLCSCFATTVVHQLASMNLISEAHAGHARRALLVIREKAETVAEAKESAAGVGEIHLDAKEKTEELPKEKVESASLEESKASETSPVTEKA